MAILVVCKKGNVRSVALAKLIKDRGIKDVVTSGVDVLLPRSWDVLGEWADKIFVVGESELTSHVPQKFKDKVRHYDIGYDRWGSPTSEELTDLLKQMTYRQGI